MSDVETGEDANRDFGEDYTETTNQSYGSKLKNACTGLCFGFLLFFGSIGLLIYNEGRTVKRAKDLDEGRENVVEIDLSNFTNASIPSSFENQLVHAVGDLNTPDVLTDPIFGVTTANMNGTATEDAALKLSRSVEVYQWTESSTSQKTNNLDGSTRTTTTYSYSTIWSSSLINSATFKDKNQSNTNPASFPFDNLVLEGDPIMLGNMIELSDRVVDRINFFEPLDTISLEDIPDETLQSQVKLESENVFYYSATNDGKNETNTTSASASALPPVVGDARITFAVVLPDTISIIAQLQGSESNDDYNLDSYTTERGGTLLLVKRGTFSSEELFTQADEENTTLAWILRFVGFFLMVISILLILQPLATAVDIIPFVGDYLQEGLECCIFPTIALVISIPTTLFVIALSWLAYRPYIAIPIVTVSLGFMIWLGMRVRKGMKEDTPNDNNNDDDTKPQGFSSAYNNNTAAPAASAAYASTYNHSAPAVPVQQQSGGDGFAMALDKPTAPYAEADIVY